MDLRSRDFIAVASLQKTLRLQPPLCKGRWLLQSKRRRDCRFQRVCANIVRRDSVPLVVSVCLLTFRSHTADDVRSEILFSCFVDESPCKTLYFFRQQCSLLLALRAVAFCPPKTSSLHLPPAALAFCPEKSGLYRSRFRSFGEMSKQSTGLFLCRSVRCFATSSLPFLVRVPPAKEKSTAKAVLFLLAEKEGLEPSRRFPDLRP